MRTGPRLSQQVPACHDRCRCAGLRAASHEGLRAWRHGPDTGRRWTDGAQQQGCRAIRCWCCSRNRTWLLPGWRMRVGCRCGTHFENYQGGRQQAVMPCDRTAAPARLACSQWPARAHVDVSGPPGVVPLSVHRPHPPPRARLATASTAASADMAWSTTTLPWVQRLPQWG